MPTYIVRKGENAIGMGWCTSEQKVGVDGVDGYNLDCDDYKSTCCASTKFLNTLEYLHRNKLS